MARAQQGKKGAAQGIPEDPDAYFRKFFAAQYAADPARYTTADTAGAAAFVVTGGGAWTFRVRGGGLEVKRGVAKDVALQVAVGPEDFRAIFVERPRSEVERTGSISDLSRDALRPLFLDARAKKIVEKARGTLGFRLADGGTRRLLALTPGAEAAAEPRATVLVGLDDFLGVVGRKKNAKLLFVMGKLRVKGDLALALHMSTLLS